MQHLLPFQVQVAIGNFVSKTTKDELLFPFMIKFSSNINEMSSEFIPFLSKHPIQHLSFFTISKNSCAAANVFILVTFIMLNHLCPVGRRAVVVNDVEVFVPNVIMTIKNGYRVHILVERISRFNIAVPHIRNSSEKHNIFEVWENQVRKSKSKVPV